MSANEAMQHLGLYSTIARADLTLREVSVKLQSCNFGIPRRTDVGKPRELFGEAPMDAGEGGPSRPEGLIPAEPSAVRDRGVVVLRDEVQSRAIKR